MKVAALFTPVLALGLLLLLHRLEVWMRDTHRDDEPSR